MSILPRSLFVVNGIYNKKRAISAMDFEELVKRGLNGDQQALSHLYNAYSHKMEKVCVKVVGDHMIAQELAHDAFILAFSKLHQLQNPKRFEQWLSSITTNVALRYINRNNTPQSVSITEITDEELYRKTELNNINNADNLPPFEAIMAAIDNLPDGYSKVFKMSVLQGMSHSEIAEILGIAAHSSSSQLARAKKMLRKSLSTYWALLLAILVIPFAYILFRDNKDKGQTLVTKQEEHGKQPQKQPQRNTPTDTTNNTPAPIVPPTQRERIYTKQYLAKERITSKSPSSLHHNDSTTSQTIDSATLDTTTIIKEHLPHFNSPNRDIFIADNEENDDLRISPIKNSNNTSKWNLNLAYTGNWVGNTNSSSPYGIAVPPPAHAGWPPSDSPSDPGSNNNFSHSKYWIDLLLNLEYWKIEYEYGSTEYYEEYGPDLTKEVLDALYMIAEANVNSGNEKIEQHSHHELPLTFSLSLRHKLDNRWGIESGLSYTHLSSQFTIGSPDAGIISNQKIDYVGIPVKVSYNWLNNPQWSLYTSLGITMEIPVYSSQYTNYVLNGKSLLQHPKSLNMPLQWSTGLGIGLQYNITPNFGVFAEPNIQYFIPDGSGIETYRTDNPYNFSIPIGFRFSW